ACALFSNLPNADGYRYEDVTAEVAACDLPLPLDGDYVGPATIVGYTVVFAGGVPSHAIAICDTPAGRRTVVRSEDHALLESMTKEEFCGRVVQVTGAAFGPWLPGDQARADAVARLDSAIRNSTLQALEVALRPGQPVH